MDAELRARGHGGAQLRLELGQSLEQLAAAGAHHALGFSSVEAFAREFCGLKRSLVRQLRDVARRLEERPRLKRALLEGKLGFHMVELLARHATAETEPFLVALAQRRTIAQMRALLKAKPDPDDEPRQCVTRTVGPHVGWLYGQTRALVEAHCGSGTGDAVWEALLAEGSTELLAELAQLELEASSGVGPANAAPLSGHSGGARSGGAATAAGLGTTPSNTSPANAAPLGEPAGADAARSGDAATAAGLGTTPSDASPATAARAGAGDLPAGDADIAGAGDLPPGDAGVGRPGDLPATAATAWQADRNDPGQISGAVAGSAVSGAEANAASETSAESAADGPNAEAVPDEADRPAPLELARRCVVLARKLARRDLDVGELSLELKWLGGYGMSEAEYADRVLGMSHSSLKGKQTLVRRLGRLPELQEALEAGRIGMEATAVVARVATQESIAAWVERAQRRTVKHLAEEVRFVERMAGISGQAPAGPPSPEQMERMHEVERDVLDGQISDITRAPLEDDPTAVRPEKMGRVRERFWMAGELADEYTRLERAWSRAGQPCDDFVAFLCVAFWKAWGHLFDADPRQYEDIYRRERYVCASPTCERRDLTPHHLLYRSQGGGDDEDNVAGLCTWCHLQGIHTRGAIRAEPPATRMIWKTPVLHVEGREVLWRRRFE